MPAIIVTTAAVTYSMWRMTAIAPSTTRVRRHEVASRLTNRPVRRVCASPKTLGDAQFVTNCSVQQRHQ